jgi:hypothetical protein
VQDLIGVRAPVSTRRETDLDRFVRVATELTEDPNCLTHFPDEACAALVAHLVRRERGTRPVRLLLERLGYSDEKAARALHELLANSMAPAGSADPALADRRAERGPRARRGDRPSGTGHRSLTLEDVDCLLGEMKDADSISRSELARRLQGSQGFAKSSLCHKLKNAREIEPSGPIQRGALEALKARLAGTGP